MIFETPLLLLLAPLLGLALAAGAWFARQRRIRRARAWSRELGREAARDGRWGPLTLGLAGLAAGLALAGPRWGRASVVTESRSLNLAIAVDISRSMLAEDASPNRLGHAVRQATRLVQDLPNDRIGVLAFAGRSYILTPLTVDGGAIRLYLDALSPDLASEGGTSLASVLAQGTALLTTSPAEAADRVLVIFTDGETHDSIGDALAAARSLRDQGVELVLVAEGGIRPVRIPLRDSTGALLGYKLDENGDVVNTSRDDAVLRQVADAAGGTLVAADLPDQAGAVRDLLSRLQRSPSAQTRVEDLVSRAWIPALIAGLLLLLQCFSRRSAALVGLAGIALLGAPLHAQRPAPGFGAAAAGDNQRAAAAFLESAKRLTGGARDTAFYNAGTAAIRLGRADIARSALEQAAKSLDPELRYRALYNLGVIDLAMAARDTANRSKLLDDASSRLQQALLLQPTSARAKWNLELAHRRKPPPSSGGGGGGGAPPPPSRGQPPPPSSGSQRPPGLDRAQAEQILNSMERQERETRTDQIERLQGGGTSGVKDW